MKIGRTVVLGGWLLAAAAAAHGAQPKKVWITIGERGYALLQQVDPAARSLESRYVANGMRTNGQAKVDRVHLVELDEGRLGALSSRIHQVLHHCAGYVTYDSPELARVALQPRQTIMAATTPSYAITHQSLLTPWVSQAGASGIEQTIKDLSAFQNRYYNGTHGAEAASALVDTWTAMADGRSDIKVETVRRGSDKMPSVVLTIQGQEKASQVVVMGAHLDTVNWNDAGGQSHEDSRAPGADDDASGIASITEALRVMIANGYKPQRTIKLIGYSGEEFGLYGSNYIASQYASDNVDVVGALQLDMTDYKGSDGDIYLMDDYTSAAQNSFIEQLAKTYQSTLSVHHDNCGYACSDHASWHDQGYAASIPFESAMEAYDPHIHSSQDTYANVGNQSEHALKFARLALTYAVELGGVQGEGGGDDQPPTDSGLKNGVPLSGLTGARNAQATYQVNLPSGARNLKIAIAGGSGDADLYTRFGSAPDAGSYDCRPYKSGNSESCSVAAPKAGTYHIMLKGYAAYSGVSLTASWTAP